MAEDTGAEALEGVRRTLARSDGLVVPDELTPEDEEDQPNPEAEKIARLMGWKPKEEWRGDTTNFRSAEDFLRETPEINRNLRKSLEATNGKLARIVGQVAKLDATSKARMSAEAEQALRAAVAEGDADEAAKILKQVESSRQPDEPPALSDFKARNAAWYEVDPEATAYVVSLDQQFARASGGQVGDPEAHMRRIEMAVKRRFPELFDDGQDDDDPPARRRKTEADDPPANGRRAPLVARGNGRAEAPSRGGKVTAASLTREQRDAAAQYNITPEKYAEQWNRMQEGSQ